jgi:Family of unknown function (DUF5694)
MLWIAAFGLCAWTASASPLIVPQGPPIDAVLLGTFHFDNPGQDLANMEVDNVLAPKRQAEIAQILDGLARFKPTKVFVESRRRIAGTTSSETYRTFRQGKMTESGNEVVQLGFRLADRLGHKEVYAVDVEGDFPFEALMEWAQKNGRGERLEANITAIQAWAADLTGQLKSKTLSQVLRLHNDPQAVDDGNAFYLDALRYGAGEEQPGANLVARWYERNFRICALIAEATEPGDRILVVYGAGHAYLLRHCLGGIPGYRIKEANDYLPK